jgi:hypothetical protein
MKKLLIIGVVGFGLVGCVSAEQQRSYNNPMKSYSEIVDIPGKTKDQIYDQSRQWIAKSFKSSNNVIQYLNAESGTIIGKGNMPFPCRGYIECSAYANSNINFTLTIDVKDNKSRMSFNDLGIHMPPSISGGVKFNGGDNLPIWQDKHKPLVESGLKEIIQDYKKSITNSNSQNW